MQKLLIGCAVLVLLSIAFIGFRSQKRENKQVLGEKIPSSTPSVSLTNKKIYLGMWTEGFWDDTTKTLDPHALIDVETTLGKKIAIAHYYRGWHELDGDSFLRELGVIEQNGWRPMVSANPYFFDGCQSNGKTLYRAIADGVCDDHIRKIASQLAAFGRPVFFRFAWEMNNPAMEWEVGKTGGTPADFVDAWRRMHDIFWAHNASNVLWIFSPNVPFTQGPSYASLYPGDRYVDWIGLDGYNWGETQPWSSWQTFADIFRTSYDALTNIAPTKPVMISEFNSTDIGGNKAVWYENTFLHEIPDSFPRIEAVVLYNEDRTVKEHVRWNIDVTTESLQSLKKALASPIYSSYY